jgi:membrane protease YdiL (CAAX protease family)
MLAVFAGLLAYLRVGSNRPRLGHLLFCSITIAFEWGVFAFTLWGSNPAFTGFVISVFQNRRSLWLDGLVALALCVISFLIAPIMVRILGPAGWASLEGMRPNNGMEIAFWIVTSISAGISEETVFRGYLQQQLASWNGHVSIGILGQAAVFGLTHGYQGWKNIVLVFVLGIIFGTAVSLRKGLRANMMAHATLDALAAF